MESMVPITMIEYIGPIDSIAVQIYNTLELVRGACHLYTGLAGYQKGILMFRLVRVNDVLYRPEDPQNAQSEEIMRRLQETLSQISEWPMKVFRGDKEVFSTGDYKPGGTPED